MGYFDKVVTIIVCWEREESTGKQGRRYVVTGRNVRGDSIRAVGQTLIPYIHKLS